MPESEEEFTHEQRLLMRLRDERCNGNAAELARKLKKDATYVNRLLYPVGKKGRKGIGLEVMRAASEAFSLAPGYWEGADLEKPLPDTLTFLNLTADETRLIGLLRGLSPAHRIEVERKANALYVKDNPQSSRANPFANAPSPASAPPADHHSQREDALAEQIVKRSMERRGPALPGKKVGKA